MYKKLLTISVICFTALAMLPSLLMADGAVSGIAVDSENGLPLSGVTVRLDETSFGGFSKSNGKFTLPAIPAGEYKLTASYIGYKPFTTDIKVEDSKTINVKIEMEVGYVIGEEVVVIGEALKGQAEALNTQKTNKNITNMIAADQMSKFPDANIGDALKRVPGITVQNDQGEARFGLVRGTAGQLNSVTLNGERVPSAEAEVRVVQLDLIPADMIQEVEVSKTLTPAQDADAIGGAINLKTRKAPADTRVSATLGGGFNPIRSGPIMNGSVIAGTRFWDNKIGIIASASLHDTKYGSDNVEGEWEQAESGDVYMNEFQIRRYDIRRQRQSYSAGLDYQISNNHNINLSMMMNKRQDWENRYRTVYKMDEPDAEGNYPTEIERQTKAGTEDIDYARLEDQRQMNFTLAGDHLFLSKIKTDWSVTYAKASEERPNERYVQWLAEDAVAGQNLSDTEFPEVTEISGADYTNFQLDELTEEFQNTFDEDINARLDFEVPLMSGQYKNVLKFGGRMRNKNKERDNKLFEYEPINEWENMTASEMENMTVDGFLPGDQYKGGEYTKKEFLGDLNLSDETLFGKEDAFIDYMPENFKANEVIYAGYAMLEQNIGKDFFVMAGVRLENTSIDYDAYEVDEDAETVKDTDGDDSYMNILPNLQIKYDLTEKVVLRAAWTNTLARPNYYDLAPYRLIVPEDNEIELGNPELEPTESMNFDFMAEYYMTSVGAFTAGAFYKDITNFIFGYSQKDYTDASGYTWDKHTQPLNGAEASLFGLEASFQRQFDFLPGFLSGFGIYANYTFTNSTVKIEDLPIDAREGEEEISLPGTCEQMINASLFYEKSGFSARVSMNFASDYIDELGDEAFYDRYYDKQMFLDVNASYEINDNFSIFADATNLTNQPLRYYQGISSRTMQMEYYNTRISGGLRYNF